ncbi:MAG: hypothetical protein ACFFD4_16120 [Candidatus Odinarchaeota archaeon]
MITQQNEPLGDIVQLILLLVAVVLLSLVLYISMRLITGKKNTDAGYLLRIVVVAVIVVIVFPVISGAINEILQLPVLDIIAGAGVAGIVLILLFVILIYLVKILLMPEAASYEKWERAIWISTIAVFFVLLINAVTYIVVDEALIPFFA